MWAQMYIYFSHIIFYKTPTNPSAFPPITHPKKGSHLYVCYFYRLSQSTNTYRIVYITKMQYFINQKQLSLWGCHNLSPENKWQYKVTQSKGSGMGVKTKSRTNISSSSPQTNRVIYHLLAFSQPHDKNTGCIRTLVHQKRLMHFILTKSQSYLVARNGNPLRLP